MLYGGVVGGLSEFERWNKKKKKAEWKLQMMMIVVQVILDSMIQIQL